jgi:hypothetical protein
MEGELAAIIERRWHARRLNCPYVFHRDGKPEDVGGRVQSDRSVRPDRS